MGSHTWQQKQASCREPQVMQFKHCYESQRVTCGGNKRTDSLWNSWYAAKILQEAYINNTARIAHACVWEWLYDWIWFICLCLCTFLYTQGSNVMEDQDLRDFGITDPGHRKKILHAARSLPKVVNVTTWIQQDPDRQCFKGQGFCMLEKKQRK